MDNPGTYDTETYKNAQTIFMGELKSGAGEVLRRMPEGPKKEAFKAAIKELAGE